MRTLGSGWDLFGLVLVGKEVLSLHSLCCLHLGPYLGRIWVVFFFEPYLDSFFFEPHLALPQLLMSIYLTFIIVLPQVWAFFKTYPSVPSKYVQFILCQLNLEVFSKEDV